MNHQSESNEKNEKKDYSEHYRRAAAVVNGNAIRLHDDSGHRYAGKTCDVVTSDEMLERLKEIWPHGEAFEYDTHGGGPYGAGASNMAGPILLFYSGK